MKNNNGMARGWKKVFRFTLVQFIKTKSFIVSTVIIALIMMLIAAGINILPKLIQDEEEISDTSGVSEIELSNVYLNDGADILTEDDIALLISAGVNIAETEKSAAELIEEMKQAEEGNAAIVTATAESEGEIVGYTVKAYYSPNTDSSSVDAAASLVSDAVSRRNLLNLGISEEDYAASQRYVTASKIEAGKDEWSFYETMINYIVPLLVSIVLFIFIFAYGQTVAQSIATEKTSRVMELLLTSVRPLAIVIGKVLAMGLISLLQFLFLGIMGIIAFLVTAPFGIGGEIMEMLQSETVQAGESAELAGALQSSFGGISPLTFILFFVIFILGFLLFALIAALVGASVSRMEDLAQAMQPYSLIGILGFYLAYFPIMTIMSSLETGAESVSGMQLFSYYFPISSPFALPSALILGTLSVPQVLVAVLILAAFDVLAALLVARVYEAIILHSGSRIKFGEILKMASKKDKA